MTSGGSGDRGILITSSGKITAIYEISTAQAKLRTEGCVKLNHMDAISKIQAVGNITDQMTQNLTHINFQEEKAGIKEETCIQNTLRRHFLSKPN